MNPYDKPLYVPMEPGAIQLSVLYEVSLNKNPEPIRFYWPAFNKAAVNASIRVFNTNEVDPVFRLRPVSQMAKVSYIYQEDNFGKVIVKNTGSDPVELKAASISVDGRYGGITRIARSGGGGSDALPVSPIPISFIFDPGPYQFWAEAIGFDAGKRVGTDIEIDIEAGSIYYWIINNKGGSFTQGDSKDATGDLLAKLQTLMIRSNPAGAQVKIKMESGVPDEIGRFEKDIGSTDARGLLTIRNADGDFISSFPGLTQGLTNKNASKVTVQFTVSRDGYIPVTQAINVLTLLEAGEDFKFDDFNLAKIASGADPNAIPTLEFVGEDVARVPAGL
jgi:flagellar hook-associated protein FlgK